MQAPASAMLSPIAVVPSQPAGASIVSALPNDASVPSAWTSTIRPMPLTMPVNMRRLSSPPAGGAVAQASGGAQAGRGAEAGRSSRRRSAPTRSMPVIEKPRASSRRAIGASAARPRPLPISRGAT